MKRFFTLLLFAVGLTLVFALAVSAESGTATFYNGEKVHLTLEVEDNSLALPIGPTPSNANQKFVGWAMELGEAELLYAPGTTVTLPDGITAPVFRAVIIEFKTLTGAAVSIGSPTTLRFDSAIGIADYDRLVALVGAENVTMGMLIAPAESITGAETNSNKFSLTCNAEGLLNRTASSFFYSNERYRVFSGRTNAIADDQLLTMYAARGYITLTTDNGQITVYTTYIPENHDRMAHYVTAMAFEDRTEIPSGAFSYSQATDIAISPYSAAALSRLEDRLDRIISISQWNSETKKAEVRIVSEFSKTHYGPFQNFVYYTSPYTVSQVLEDSPAGYDTYVITANEGADTDNVAAYYIGKSYRDPKPEEWRENAIYISVVNTTN